MAVASASLSISMLSISLGLMKLRALPLLPILAPLASPPELPCGPRPIGGGFRKDRERHLLHKEGHYH